MNYTTSNNKIVLATFLNKNTGNVNVFENFNMISHFNKIKKLFTPICPICLESCSRICHPNSCYHQFCYECINFWSKTKPKNFYIYLIILYFDFNIIIYFKIFIFLI